MGKFLQFPLPFHSKKHEQESEQSQSNCYLQHSSPSSSNSSLISQSSLPSVSSLTPPTQQPTTAHHHLIATLKAHSAYIFSLTLAGKHLYTADSNGEIRVWDRDPSSLNSSSNNNNTVVQGHSPVKSIIPLGNTLFTAHHDHKIRVWKFHNDSTDHKLIATLPTVKDRFTSLLSAQKHVTIPRNKKCSWVNHLDAVSALAVSTDGALLYSVSWDRSLKVWRTSDFKCLESIQDAHDDAINAVVLSNDGHVYTGSADKKIKVWKRNDGEKKFKLSLVSTLEKHKSAVNALALSTDGSVLYSGACDRSIIVWENDGGGGERMAVAGALRGHSKAILCLSVVSDLVFSGSADKSMRIWKRGSGGSYFCLCVLGGHNGPVKCLTAARLDDKNGGDDDLGNSYLLYSGGLDFDIKVWEIWVPF
ncbi:hypothetical protein ACJIZ3_025582 [Penstemon smallii]|uniref:Uncharacterized protein n=1 Tax=Penstemon smallii TaxID=265156 RepID=A0ABD3TWQ6_9LAMI